MRKRALLLTLIFILSLIPLPSSKAAQMFYFSFDYQQWYTITPEGDTWTQGWNDTWTLQKTYILQSASGVYWSFVYVEVEHNSTDGQNTYTERRVMVKVYADDRYITFKSIQAVFHDGVMKFYIPVRLDNPAKNFKIEIYSSTGDGATIQYTVKLIKVLAVSDKGYAIDTTMLGPYTPPEGALGSTHALILNHTEADLQQTISLSTGSLRFWLKWDGTKPLKLLDTLGIDENGTLYFIAGGTKYVLDYALPQDKWIVIALAWKEGEAYFLASETANADNATIATFTWSGNFEFSQIGDINQTSSSALDEFVVWDDYIDKSSILAVESKVLLKLDVNGREVPVYPDGGAYLPTPLTISFYDSNNSLITYQDWYGTDQKIAVPSGTKYILLSGGSASTAILIDQIGNAITFPAKGTTLVAEKINIVPATAGVLKVTNMKGQLLYAQQVTSGGTIVGVMGEMYYISFTDTSGATRAAGWFTPTGDGITLVLSSDVTAEKGVWADAWWDNNAKALKVAFSDDRGMAQDVNITIRFFLKDKLVGEFPITEHTSKYIGTFYPPDIADFAQVVIRTSEGYSKTIGVVINEDKSTLVPESVIPGSLLMGLFAITGLLIAPARFKYLSTLIATAIMIFAKLIGIFDSPSWLIATLTGLTLLSFIIYRPSSRGGVV